MPLDLDTCLYLDFEARSQADITDVGAHAYAEHPTTEPLCCAWVIGLQAPIKLWKMGEPLPTEWYIHANGNAPLVAHNKDTERQLLACKMDMKIAAHRWIDSASVASAAGMPRNLHDVGESLKLPVQKQSRAAMLALCKPRKLSKKNTALWWTPEERPDLYESMYAYCRADVDVMRKAMAALPPYHWVMPPKEEKLAVLTDQMNDLGVEVDLGGVAKAQAVVAEHGARLRAEFALLYPGVNPRHAPSVSKALGMDNSRKETVRDELKSATGPRAAALTLLKTIKTASTAKLVSFLEHACADGRIHGAMVFHGAGRTGRWSSMGVQLHNLVRGLGVSTPDWPAVDESPDAMETFFGALHAGIMDLIYSDPTRATAAAMRGFLWEPRQGLLSGDFAQIEARALVTWAGQTDMVDAFKRKQDPYKMMAARIYVKPVAQVSKDERFMGKQSVLGAGYGVGRFGFQSMLKVQYDVDVTEEEAARIVTAYREANPKVKALWGAVERLAKQTLLEKPQNLICASDVPMIAMRMVRKWLVVRLPSGRCLWYFEPELATENIWEEDEPAPGEFLPKKRLVGQRTRIMYWGRDIKLGGRWARVKTYGGKLVENITQAMARDVMADAMLRLNDAGFKVTMTVHDEIVAPGPAARMEEFDRVMREPPMWWKDLPLDVEVQHKRRYQK